MYVNNYIIMQVESHFNKLRDITIIYYIQVLLKWKPTTRLKKRKANVNVCSIYEQ